MLMKRDISLIHVNQAVAQSSEYKCCCLLSCGFFNANNQNNIINFSKKSALTVSQQLRINQQLVIGEIGHALAGLRQ